jgi:group I intron endonuclease
MNNYVVYVHTNKTNGKRYVGITNNISKRWCANGRRYEECPHFWAAIKKYGWNGFTHEVIETGLTIDEANEAEKYYIAKYKTCNNLYGYNIQPGGDFVPTMTGKHHTEETRAKMRAKARGRVISDEQRRSHSAWMRQHFVGDKNPKSRPVKCINTGEIFECQRAAAEAKGVNQSKISLCCQGKRTHTHGYRWEFA